MPPRKNPKGDEAGQRTETCPPLSAPDAAPRVELRLEIENNIWGGGGPETFSAHSPRRHRENERVRVGEFALVGAVRAIVWRSGRRLGGWIAVVVGVLVLALIFVGTYP